MKKILIGVGILFAIALIGIAVILGSRSTATPEIPQVVNEEKPWEYLTSTDIQTVISDEDQVYICEAANLVTALKKTTGEVVWTQPVQCPHNDFDLSENQDILLSSSSSSDEYPEGTVALDKKTGAILWKKKIRGVHPEAEHESNLIFQERIDDGIKLLSLQTSTGQENWSLITPGETLNEIKLNPSHTIIVGHNSGIFPGDQAHLTAVDINTGKQLWQITMPHEVFNSADNFEVSNNHVFLFFSKEIKMYNLHTGELEATHAYSGFWPQNTVVTDEDKSFLVELHLGLDTLIVTNLETGKQLWESRLPPNDTTEPLSDTKGSTIQITDDNNILTYSNDQIILFELQTGNVLWQQEFKTGPSSMSEVSVLGGQVFAVNNSFADPLYVPTMTIDILSIKTGELIKHTVFPAGETLEIDQGPFVKKPLLYENSIVISKSNLPEVIAKRVPPEELAEKYYKVNLATNKETELLSVDFAIGHTYSDGENYFQYQKNRLVSNP